MKHLDPSDYRLIPDRIAFTVAHYKSSFTRSKAKDLLMQVL